MRRRALIAASIDLDPLTFALPSGARLIAQGLDFRGGGLRLRIYVGRNPGTKRRVPENVLLWRLASRVKDQDIGVAQVESLEVGQPEARRDKPGNALLDVPEVGVPDGGRKGPNADDAAAMEIRLQVLRGIMLQLDEIDHGQVVFERKRVRGVDEPSSYEQSEESQIHSETALGSGGGYGHGEGGIEDGKHR
jgi:hypothetical protein